MNDYYGLCGLFGKKYHDYRKTKMSHHIFSTKKSSKEKEEEDEKAQMERPYYIQRHLKE